MTKFLRAICFNALTGLSCYCDFQQVGFQCIVSMPLWAWVVTSRFAYFFWTCWSFNALMGLSCYFLKGVHMAFEVVSMPLWAWVVTEIAVCSRRICQVSMPLWAWVVTWTGLQRFINKVVSMPLWAWVVTARMSNILNFSWYFLCIPAIYRCILAYLPIFFNQLSKFLRCESPSTFLGTCLSHHYFIIFLVTNTNTLLSGLYLISTAKEVLTNNLEVKECQCPLRLIPHFYIWKLSSISLSSRARCQCPLGLIPHFYPLPKWMIETMFKCVNALSGLYLISTLVISSTSFLPFYGVNALSGLYLISTEDKHLYKLIELACQCPLGLIPHFYGTPSKT